MIDWIRELVWRYTHAHYWTYAGRATDMGSEKWYWHVEECQWCPKRRTVLNNNGHCACEEI